MGKYIEYTLRSIFNILFPLNKNEFFWISYALMKNQEYATITILAVYMQYAHGYSENFQSFLH